MYCDLSYKRYQLGDWRVRPLPDEMLKYARVNTHFLLYIYDNYSAPLDCTISHGTSPTSHAGSPTAPNAFVREVLSRSAEIALRVYSPDSYDAEDESTGKGAFFRSWPRVMIDGVLDSLPYLPIHSTPVVAPIVPRAPLEVTAITTIEAVTTPAPDVPIDRATTEIPFVLAALRQNAKSKVIDDAIVVVGQRQKKHKHTRKAVSKSSAVP
ncbi:hypothetical protein EDB87DRAFT_535734 [Lactarius vividus]|nr:hypothetical protein EDB87DRAFT_535734 [Lactarius vividus]